MCLSAGKLFSAEVYTSSDWNNVINRHKCIYLWIRVWLRQRSFDYTRLQLQRKLLDIDVFYRRYPWISKGVTVNFHLYCLSTNSCVSNQKEIFLVDLEHPVSPWHNNCLQIFFLLAEIISSEHKKRWPSSLIFLETFLLDNMRTHQNFNVKSME